MNIQGTKYHFIGIGGIGVSGLAKMLIGNGAVVRLVKRLPPAPVSPAKISYCRLFSFKLLFIISRTG